MQRTDTLTNFFNHHLWANLRLLDRCAELSDEQLAATAIGTYGSICATLQHIATSEKDYFLQISADQQYSYPEDAPPLTLAEIREWLIATGSGLIEWSTKIQPDDTITVDWDGEMRAIPKSVILTQCINHATEHREQIKVILTQLGIQPPSLMGWRHFDELYRQS